MGGRALVDGAGISLLLLLGVANVLRRAVLRRTRRGALAASAPRRAPGVLCLLRNDGILLITTRSRGGAF